MASEFFTTPSLSLLLIFSYFLLRTEANKTLSLSFPLTAAPLTSKNTYLFSSLAASTRSRSRAATGSPRPPFDYSSRTTFNYSMALIVSLAIGTPPQDQRMVIDTGSQLSWIMCGRKMRRKTKRPNTTSFDPSLSSSFSNLPCNHLLCKPRIPYFTLSTDCDANRHCHYSYFYADGTYAEGNLIREKFAFPGAPPLILGCANEEASEAEGILGMNLGRLSFVHQAKIDKFSYCTPRAKGMANGRPNLTKKHPTGAFYLGKNPNSGSFRYVDLLTFPRSPTMPNLDPLAYTLPLSGIKIAGRKLRIPPSAFRPDASGFGQTMIDSGTQYTFLVDQAYGMVRKEVVTRAGRILKHRYVYARSLDMCFDKSKAAEAKQLIGVVVFVFDNGVEISIDKERIMDDVGGGVHCIAIGRSESLGVPSNIIGNFYQQNLWVEFDLIKKRVAFGRANCH